MGRQNAWEGDSTMSRESWSEFFSMGGYGFYVWGSYLMFFICIVGEMLLISKRRRTLQKHLGLIHQPITNETENETSS